MNSVHHSLVHAQERVRGRDLRHARLWRCGNVGALAQRCMFSQSLNFLLKSLPPSFELWARTVVFLTVVSVTCLLCLVKSISFLSLLSLRVVN